MIKSLFLILLLFQNCNVQRFNLPDNGTVSSSIQRYVQDSMLGFSFIEDSLAKSKEFNMESYEKRYYSCISDFNDDKIEDYALLLKLNDEHICLVIFTIINETVNHTIIDCFNRNIEVGELQITIEPKGKWEAIDRIIYVPVDGIMVDNLEESISISYYWNKTRFEKFIYD